MPRWQCQSCGHVTDEKPSQCGECGGYVFETYGSESSVSAPGPIDAPGERGTAKSGGDDSPAVTLRSEGPTDDSGKATSSVGPFRRLAGGFRSGWYKARATILSPLWLLRRYILALIAFALVFYLLVYGVPL